MKGIAGTVSWERGAKPKFANAVVRGPETLAFDGCLYTWPGEARGANDADRWLNFKWGLPIGGSAIEGDFAVARWFDRQPLLQLTRDRFGLRPLYYARTKTGAVFASRIVTLFALTGLPIVPRAKWVARYAASHYRTFDDEEALTPFEGVMQVPAGAIVTLTEHETRVERYWSLEEQGDLEGDEDSLAEQLRELVHAAVARRVQRARKPMFTLSGGMDSSSVLFTAARVMNEKPVACSAVYEHAEYDESQEVRESLAGTGIDWQPIEVSNALDLDLLAQAIGAHDEPIATSTWLAHYQLCKAASAMGVTELFDGLGGDELNAGEYEYFPLFFADLRAAEQFEALAHEIDCWAKLHDHPIHRKSREVAHAMMAQLADDRQRGWCRANSARTLRYADVLADRGELLRSFSPALVHPFASYLKNRTYQDLTRETMPCCLRASERNTAAFGMVNRSPFLDRELVEFMFRIPGTMKIRDGVTKRLLREAMRGVLPEVTRTRTKKVGWNAPSDRWFVGAGADMMRDLVSSQRFRERGVYDSIRLLGLIDEHEQIIVEAQPRENHMMLLWQALNLELWLREVEGWGRAPRKSTQPSVPADSRQSAASR